MTLSGAFYMAMPLAIIGSKFDQAFQHFENQKLMQDKNWAKNQIKRLQNVTTKERRRRALQLGYQIAEEIGNLNEWDEVWEEMRENVTGTSTNTKKNELEEKTEIISCLLEDAGKKLRKYMYYCCFIIKI
jgi:hypothetical protein